MNVAAYNPGDFKSFIKIREKTTFVNEFGIPQEEYSVIRTARCIVKNIPIVKYEIYRSQGIISISSLEFIIRANRKENYNSKIELEYKGKIYDVQNVKYIEDGYISMMAKLVE